VSVGLAETHVIFFCLIPLVSSIFS